MGFFDDNEEYTAIEEGTCTAKIVDISMDNDKGYPRISIQYALDNNRRIFQNFNFNEKGSKFIVWQFGILGINDKVKEATKNSEDYEVIAKSYLDISGTLLNKYVQISVSHREYNGKTYENVKLLNLIGDDKPVSMPAATSTTQNGVDTTESLPF